MSIISQLLIAIGVRPHVCLSTVSVDLRRTCNIHVGKTWVSERPCENKGADELRSYCEADLHLCFCIAKIRFSHGASQLLRS